MTDRCGNYPRDRNRKRVTSALGRNIAPLLRWQVCAQWSKQKCVLCRWRGSACVLAQIVPGDPVCFFSLAQLFQLIAGLLEARDPSLANDINRSETYPGEKARGRLRQHPTRAAQQCRFHGNSCPRSGKKACELFGNWAPNALAKFTTPRRDRGRLKPESRTLIRRCGNLQCWRELAFVLVLAIFASSMFISQTGPSIRCCCACARGRFNAETPGGNYQHYLFPRARRMAARTVIETPRRD